MQSVHDLTRRIAELESQVLTLKDKLSRKVEPEVIVKRVEVPVERIVTKRVEVPVDRIVTKRVEVPVDRVVYRDNPDLEMTIKAMRAKISRYEDEIRKLSNAPTN